MTTKSIWLNPQRSPVYVGLNRFDWYEYFRDAIEQYVGLEVPLLVPVHWGPFKNFVEALPPADVAAEGSQDYIDYVAELIKDGRDVPPLVVDGAALFDGRHRARAARSLGIRKAPIMDVHPYWKR